MINICEVDEIVGWIRSLVGGEMGGLAGRFFFMIFNFLGFKDLVF